MIVQIYTMQTPEEAVALAEVGVDHLGITPSNHDLPGEIDYDMSRKIFKAVGDRAVKVALTVDTDLKIIAEMAAAVRPDILHICGPIEGIDPEGVRTLRGMLPAGMKIMQAIPVGKGDSVALALAYQAVSDYLILDTDVDHIGGIGASGEVHDWNLSREIVEKTDIPVILAGGLSAENVAEAIAFVNPWGVDSLTHTNRPFGADGFRKDVEKVRRFVKNAKGTGFAG